ncbi:hypothetical protein AQUCO_03800050v1 [Aquilegia coerulea]|uniref:Protein kinase domain-containing protein n=1 Tax=Aquilegia coerulea TaxID=218851 RepID=A0A2G5CTH6_AQUCA|nr:hypothetical protein AQUCO_03800050v1 [Aquilegia coerulea]
MKVDDMDAKAFEREVSILKYARHPNIVQFMGVVVGHSIPTIVTEFVPIGDLHSAMQKPEYAKKFTLKQRLLIALDVAKGLNYLHGLDTPIVHLDLKSPNLLLDKKFSVKICDFGLSRFRCKAHISLQSATGFTAAWCAPEVLEHRHSDEKADIFSFGVVLWELWTKKSPWDGYSPFQVIKTVAMDNKRLDIPEDMWTELASLMELCWDKNPERRPSSTDVLNSLVKVIKTKKQLLEEEEVDSSSRCGAMVG